MGKAMSKPFPVSPIAPTSRLVHDDGTGEQDRHTPHHAMYRRLATGAFTMLRKRVVFLRWH